MTKPKPKPAGAQKVEIEHHPDHVEEGDITAVSPERVRKYLGITRKALNELKQVTPANSHNERIARDFLTMASSYFTDAQHFYEKGNLVDSFACINYAHGWLDAGARLGLWDTGGSELFTV